MQIALRQIDAGIIHQNIRPADGAFHLGECSGNLLFIGQISRHNHRPAANHLRGFFQRFNAPPGQCNLGTFSGKADGNRAANAAARPGDPGGFSFKTFHYKTLSEVGSIRCI